MAWAFLALDARCVRAAAVSWIGGNGDWETAANWSTGTLPMADDDVTINRPGNITITHSGGTHAVKSMLSHEAFVLSGGSLVISNTIRINNGFSISGGTLINGTILPATNGQAIAVTSGTLDGVTLSSDVSVPDSASLTIVNGLTLAGGATITLNSAGGSSYLHVDAGTQTIGGNGQIVLAGTGPQNQLRLGNSGGTTLTLGPGVTVRGQGTISQWNTSTLLNQGTIQADVPGQTLTVGPANSFTNSGVLRAINGASLSLEWDWENSGSIEVNNATLNLGGTFNGATTGFSRNGGVVNITGTLQGGLMLTPTTGSWKLDGGTIRGGTISVSGGAQLLVTHGTLDGVTLSSDVSVPDSASLAIVNGLTLAGGAAITLNSAGGSSYLHVDAGTQTIGGNGQIVLAGTGPQNQLRLGNSGGTTLTLGPGVTVRGQGTISQWNTSTLLNQGTIQADVPGQTLTVGPANSFTNSGVLRAINGASLRLEGDHELGGGTLNVGINSSTQYGRIDVIGSLISNGGFAIDTINGFLPNPQDTFTILTYTSATNEFVYYSGLDLGEGLFLVPQFGSTRLKLTTATYPTNSQPSLFVGHALGGVRVLWTSGFPDWTLLSATNLTSAPWLPITANVFSNQVVLPATAAQQYFRLRQ